jgi:protein tyrosine phosphatase (PTP) superfamily phosphohydrolase (DUF442 family)
VQASAGWLSWIGDERIAVGAQPTTAIIARLKDQGITHIVNCRTRLDPFMSRELSLERKLFGRANVGRAPMLDTGWRQHPRRWAAAATFAADALDRDQAARVLVHCRAGVHRSVLVAYAILRLRGHSAAEAAALIRRHRAEADLLKAYQASVDDWIAAQ